MDDYVHEAVRVRTDICREILSEVDKIYPEGGFFVKGTNWEDLNVVVNKKNGDKNVSRYLTDCVAAVINFNDSSSSKLITLIEIIRYRIKGKYADNPRSYDKLNNNFVVRTKPGKKFLEGIIKLQQTKRLLWSYCWEEMVLKKKTEFIAPPPDSSLLQSILREVFDSSDNELQYNDNEIVISFTVKSKVWHFIQYLNKNHVSSPDYKELDNDVNKFNKLFKDDPFSPPVNSANINDYDVVIVDDNELHLSWNKMKSTVKKSINIPASNYIPKRKFSTKKKQYSEVQYEELQQINFNLKQDNFSISQYNNDLINKFERLQVKNEFLTSKLLQTSSALISGQRRKGFVNISGKNNCYLNSLIQVNST